MDFLNQLAVMIAILYIKKNYHYILNNLHKGIMWGKYTLKIPAKLYVRPKPSLNRSTNCQATVPYQTRTPCL